MTEWWTPSQAGVMGAILGGGGGALLGLLGALAGVLAPRGKGRPWLPWAAIAAAVLGFAALGVGIAAFALRQPWHVAWPPMNIGIIGATLGTMMWFLLRRVYAHHDHRRVEAASLRRQ